MKSKSRYVVGCLLLSFVATGMLAEELAPPVLEKNSQVTPAKTVNDTLVVTGRVLEIPGKFPPNDAYDYVYIMKYRVMVVEKGAYAEKEILVGHYNPLIPRKLIKDKMDRQVDGSVERFTLGDKHRLVLLPIDKCWKGPVEDEYVDEEREAFFAVRVDGVK